MKQIDGLIMRARRMLSSGGGLFIIRKEAGKWMIEGREFPSEEAAEQYIDDMAGNTEEITVIINDAGSLTE